MTVGVQKSLEAVEGVRKLAEAVIEIALKGGAVSPFKYMELLPQLVELAKDIKDSVPEVQDLDVQEMGQLIAAGGVAMIQIIQSIKSK